MRLLTPAHRLAATIAALACAALTGAAFAQSPNVVELQRDPGVRAAIGSCMADRGRLCSGVAPGSGRIARCLAARSEALSPACRIAMEKASSVLMAAGVALIPAPPAK